MSLFFLLKFTSAVNSEKKEGNQYRLHHYYVSIQIQLNISNHTYYFSIYFNLGLETWLNLVLSNLILPKMNRYHISRTFLQFIRETFRSDSPRTALQTNILWFAEHWELFSAPRSKKVWERLGYYFKVALFNLITIRHMWWQAL